MSLKYAACLLFLLCCFFAQAEQESDDSDIPEVLPTAEARIEKRLRLDAYALQNPFSISQHKTNYLLPFTYLKNPNQASMDEQGRGGIDNTEAKFQISVKMPVYTTNVNGEGLYFGFTAMSYWQVYNSEASKPFRETNYEPEIFYNWLSDYKILGYKFNVFQVGLNHQSNGQNQLTSRSWNRIYGSMLFNDESSLYYLKAWYRIPEDDKEDPLDPLGDDNPDITDYLGHFEFGYGNNIGHFKMLALLRNNLKSSNNRGSIELNLTYPISDRYELLLQYFNGYGDSLIDYNHSQERIGLGIQLSFL